MLKNERDASYPETFALVCSIKIRNQWLVYVNDNLERLLKFRWPVIAVLSGLLLQYYLMSLLQKEVIFLLLLLPLKKQV